MAVQRRLSVDHIVVFPSGAYLVGGVEPVADFQAPADSNGVRPQMRDPETNLPVWVVQVVDADPNAGKREKTVSVKIAAASQPVPPKQEGGLPFTAVEFTGLCVTPYVDDNGSRPRLAWSFRAQGMQTPRAGNASKSSAQAA